MHLFEEEVKPAIEIHGRTGGISICFIPPGCTSGVLTGMWMIPSCEHGGGELGVPPRGHLPELFPCALF